MVHLNLIEISTVETFKYHSYCHVSSFCFSRVDVSLHIWLGSRTIKLLGNCSPTAR